MPWRGTRVFYRYRLIMGVYMFVYGSDLPSLVRIESELGHTLSPTNDSPTKCVPHYLAKKNYHMSGYQYARVSFSLARSLHSPNPQQAWGGVGSGVCKQTSSPNTQTPPPILYTSDGFESKSKSSTLEYAPDEYLVLEWFKEHYGEETNDWGLAHVKKVGDIPAIFAWNTFPVIFVDSYRK